MIWTCQGLALSNLRKLCVESCLPMSSSLVTLLSWFDVNLSSTCGKIKLQQLLYYQNCKCFSKGAVTLLRSQLQRRCELWSFGELAGGRFTVAQACNRVVVRLRTLAATRMICVIVLSMLKTIFFQLRSDQYVSQTQGSFSTHKSLASTSLPGRTNRTKVVSTSFLIRFTIAMKSLCHGLATPQQPSCKGVASLLQSYSKFPCNSHASI